MRTQQAIFFSHGWLKDPPQRYLPIAAWEQEEVQKQKPLGQGPMVWKTLPETCGLEEERAAA